eukprot:1875170-Alexandrium_andersonii.AAC.1
MRAFYREHVPEVPADEVESSARAVAGVSVIGVPRCGPSVGMCTPGVACPAGTWCVAHDADMDSLA